MVNKNCVFFGKQYHPSLPLFNGDKWSVGLFWQRSLYMVPKFSWIQETIFFQNLNQLTLWRNRFRDESDKKMWHNFLSWRSCNNGMLMTLKTFKGCAIFLQSVNCLKCIQTGKPLIETLIHSTSRVSNRFFLSVYDKNWPRSYILLFKKLNMHWKWIRSHKYSVLVSYNKYYIPSDL